MDKMVISISKNTFDFLKSLVEVAEGESVEPGRGNVFFRVVRSADPEQLAYVVKEIQQVRPHNILID